MTTTTRQDREFAETIMDQGALERAIDWIRTNLGPGDVFEHEQLLAWARDNLNADELA